MSESLHIEKTDHELLRDYWNAQAQFGPFEVGPMEFLRNCRDADRDRAYQDDMRRG